MIEFLPNPTLNAKTFRKREHYLFRNIQKISSGNNSVLASTRFLTFDWVPMLL